MVNASAVLFSLLFADDTNVFVTGKIYQTLWNLWILSYTKLTEWMHVVKLSLNITMNPLKKVNISNS